MTEARAIQLAPSMTRRILIALAAAGLLTVSMATTTSAASPTCSEMMGIEVHGRHIIGDYVIGGGLADWPPAGQVGSAIAGQGVEIRGGPGPGFHFEFGFAPGASFCLEQSRSPGSH